MAGAPAGHAGCSGDTRLDPPSSDHRHGGYIFKHTGDGVCAAFPVASEGMGAALEAPLNLNQEDWGDVPSLKVRMGVHSGEAQVREGDYFGPTLNFTARLMSIGHGGQVLLSQTAGNLGRDHLPTDTALLDLGLHQLRDISQQECVFQLVCLDLQRDFPALKSLHAHPLR